MIELLEIRVLFVKVDVVKCDMIYCIIRVCELSKGLSIDVLMIFDRVFESVKEIVVFVFVGVDVLKWEVK